MFYNEGENMPTIVIENGICPLCGGDVNLDTYICEHCGELSAISSSIITIGSTTCAETIRKAAQGDPESQMAIGWNYEQWDMFPFNQKLANYWYLKAASQGNANAQSNLSIQYLTGRGGIEQSNEKAAYWAEKAAQQGFDKAQANIGAFYLSGIGVEEDDSKGFYWLQKAAEQGHKQAEFNLACCYLNGKGTQINNERALYWLKKSALHGYVQAQDLLDEID